jgi:hypothetical protein
MPRTRQGRCFIEIRERLLNGRGPSEFSKRRDTRKGEKIKEDSGG